MTVNLDTLPAEVLDLVALLTDAKDLKTIRLVCKTLHNAATKPFGEAIFAERLHVISEHSLAEMVLMSANPNFGPYMRQLGFNCILRLPFIVPCGHNDRARFKAAATLAKVHDEQLEFLTSGCFEDQLVLVLENLRGWGSQPIKLHLSCDDSPVRGWGWLNLLPGDALAQQTLMSRRQINRPLLQHTSAVFANAVQAAKYPTTGIILDFKERSPGPTAILENYNTRLVDGHTWASLTHHIPGGDLLSRRSGIYSRNCYDSIHYVPSTKMLKLKSGTTRDIFTDFYALTRWLPVNALTTLIIKDVAMRWDHTMEGCLMRSRQLKHLEMDTCMFWDKIWSVTFARLCSRDARDALTKLEYCRFSKIYYEQLELFVRGEELVQACAETHEFKGRDEVLAGLELLSVRFEALEVTVNDSDSSD